MLYVFIGTDRKTSEAKARACVAGLRAREPFATQIALNEENIESVQFEDLLATQGLFKDKMIITLTSIFSSPHAERASEYVKSFEKSEHIVIAVDGELKAAEKNLLKKHAHTLVESEAKIERVETYNPFALADALYARDAKALFVRLEEARLRGDELESTVGLLSWAAKAMLLASVSDSPASSGLKPFVHTKAKQGARAWGAQLPELVRSCAYVPHASRMYGREGHEELMRMVLRLCA